MRSIGRVGLVIAAISSILSMVDDASAQLSLAGMNVQGDVWGGTRFFIEEPSKTRQGKFQEYRDIHDGLFLGGAHLRLFRPDESYSFALDGYNWGREDQYFSLGGTRVGLWELGFEWDQTPHVYSTNARILATETSPGTWVLPTPRPNLAAFNTGREIDEISTRWDTARLSMMLTPTPDLELKAEYTRIHKDGSRPMAIHMGSPLQNFVDVLAPVNETIHDLRLGGTLAREQWQLIFGYNFSRYDNHQRSASADNPCFGNNTDIFLGGCANGAGNDNIGAQRTGLMSLAPDNMAHTFSLGGAVNLPMRTRISTNFSYSLRFQNESFLAQTINPALASNPVIALPRKSLDGVVGTTLFNLNATSRPLTPLTLSFKYRLFDFDDMTDRVVFPFHARNDRQIVFGMGDAANDPAPRIARRYEYTRQNADLDARWRFGSPVALTVGTGWENWHRNSAREVSESNEYFGKAAVDVTPIDWLLARLSYKASARVNSNYNPDVLGVADPQFPLLSKLDEGERERHRVELLLQVMPLDNLTISWTGSVWKDDYFSSPYGLQRNDSWSTGIDVSWSLAPRVSVTGGYVHESEYRKIRNRHRPPLTPDFIDFDWVSDETDTTDTIHLRANVVLIPATLTWMFGGSYTYGISQIETRNPATPSSGAVGQNFLATATPFPAFDYTLLRLETGVTYQINKAWSTTLGYVFDSFSKHDWRTDSLTPWAPGVPSIFLGSDVRNYTAHIIGLTARYQFQ